jgi:hypothetical protein
MTRRASTTERPMKHGPERKPPRSFFEAVKWSTGSIAKGSCTDL